MLVLRPQTVSQFVLGINKIEFQGLHAQNLQQPLICQTEFSIKLWLHLPPPPLFFLISLQHANSYPVSTIFFTLKGIWKIFWNEFKAAKQLQSSFKFCYFKRACCTDPCRVKSFSEKSSSAVMTRIVFFNPLLHVFLRV